MNRGKIHSIYVKNFVTFSEYTVYPGLHLNVITGPNGVGKSTIVAAILLGMGGNPKLLSRATSIEDFIKNGQSEATIKLQLYVDNKTFKTFQRSFNASKKDEWKIDGKQVSCKEYERIVKTSFNIQIDNLCQFLPQDRVQDFSNQNSAELLLNTQISVCSPSIVKKFQELKECRNMELQGTKNTTDLLAKLKETKTRYAELQSIIDKMNEKREFLIDIDVCISKKSWIEVLELRDKEKTMQIELEHTKQFVERDQHEYDQIKKKTRGIIGIIENLKEITNESNTRVKHSSESIGKIQELNEEFNAAIRKEKNDFASKQAEEIERQNEEEQARRVLEVIVHDIKNHESGLDHSEKFQHAAKTFENSINEIRKEMNNLLADRRKITQQSDNEFAAELEAIKRRIENMKNMSDRRLNFLRKERTMEDVYKAVLWLRENCDMFEGKIYEPMMLELNVKNQSYAKYFENTIPLQDLLAFTCESKKDVSLLSNKLCVEQRLKINILYSAPSSICTYSPSESVDQYRKFGFFAYLIDLVHGPAPILNYLCSVHQIHKILVGGEEANNFADKLPNHFRLFFAGNQRYNISYSRYTKQASSSRTTITERNWLSMALDQHELAKLQNQYESKMNDLKKLMNKKTEIEAMYKQLEEKKNAILTEKRTHEAKEMAFQEIKERLSTQNKKLKRIKDRKIDVGMELIKFKKSADTLINKMVENHKSKIAWLKKYQETVEEHEFNKHIYNVVQLENADIEHQVIAAKENVEKARKLYDTIANALAKTNNEIKTKLTTIKKLCNGVLPSDPHFSYDEKYNEIPNEISQLCDHINELQARVECMVADNQSVISEHETKGILINDLEQNIQQVQNDYQSVNDRLNTLHNEWFPKITEVIGEINKNFGEFMKEMGYVGQVDLIYENQRDYNTYGIQILVQYRNNEKLQPLTRSRQSGGERAVAIAVYSLSLQHLTDVPFRCVDEINQGMDPRNERKIFQMLVTETSRDDKSQYFYITPKLLSGLLDNYNKPLDKLTWLIVYQSKFD